MGKLKLNLTSKDKDKKARRKAKKAQKLLKLQQQDHLAQARNETVHTRRRFENQSGRRDRPSDLSKSLTKSQLNKITTLASREVGDLLHEAGTSYREKQNAFNKYCQTVTETNEMPCLVMTKIK